MGFAIALPILQIIRSIYSIDDDTIVSVRIIDATSKIYMASISNVQVTISLQDPNLDDQELQAKAENLLPQLREVDGVQQADLVAVATTPQGSKALGGFLLGVLTAEVNPANIKAVFQFLGDRLGGKPLKLTVKKPDGTELSLEASSQAEIDFLTQKAQEFLKSSAG